MSSTATKSDLELSIDILSHNDTTTTNDYFKKSINDKDLWIINYLKKVGTYVSPKTIGESYGFFISQPYKNGSWVSFSCKKLENMGILVANDQRAYKFKKVISANEQSRAIGFFTDSKKKEVFTAYADGTTNHPAHLDFFISNEQNKISFFNPLLWDNGKIVDLEIIYECELQKSKNSVLVNQKNNCNGQYSVSQIYEMNYDQLAELINNNFYDRLGCKEGKFFMLLMPTETEGDDLNMFVEINEEVVKEFFVRLLCKEEFRDYTY
ncbi:MAG: hypothetical protein RBQ78_06320 [Acholeplasmataceae bacterium]|jgi:hypothetical protein|nr:hypothetical protein [Acholeplasmataceae bacterium]